MSGRGEGDYSTSGDEMQPAEDFSDEIIGDDSSKDMEESESTNVQETVAATNKKKKKSKARKGPRSERALMNGDEADRESIERSDVPRKTKKKLKTKSSKAKKKPESERSLINDEDCDLEISENSILEHNPEISKPSLGRISDSRAGMDADDILEDRQSENGESIESSDDSSSNNGEDPEDFESSDTTTDDSNEDTFNDEPGYNSKRKYEGLSSVSLNSRLNTSLMIEDYTEYDSDDTEKVEVIDVDELMEMNLKKEMERQSYRKNREKNKNVKEGIDPRLFPSYHEKEETSEDDGGENSTSEDGSYTEAKLSSRWQAFSSRWRSMSRKDPNSESELDDDPLDKMKVVSAIRGRKIVHLRVMSLPTGEIDDPKIKRRVDQMLQDSESAGKIYLDNPEVETKPFGSPLRLLEIESGRAFLVRGSGDEKKKARKKKKKTMLVVSMKARTFPTFLQANSSVKDEKTHQQILLREKIASGNIRDLEAANPEFGGVNRLRFNKLRRQLVASLDPINALGLGRKLLPSIGCLTGYEAYLMEQLLEVLDRIASELDVSKKKRNDYRKLRQTEFDEILMYAFKNQNVSRIIEENVELRWNFHIHWFQLVSKSRWYDVRGRLPIKGLTKFPPSENYPSADYGFVKFWMKDLEASVALNVTEKCDGFEVDQHNMYGAHAGRTITNQFRIDNRLPTDECVHRAFIASPIATMINNGAVHVLRILAKHWNKILKEPFGSFILHRTELLDPFETMRFYIPSVCVALLSSRGRNVWDSEVLAPFIRKCQELNTSGSIDNCSFLIKEMKSKIVSELCAGVVAIENPLLTWLDAILESLVLFENEAKTIYREITGVEIGLRFGYDIMTQVSWKIPSDSEIETAIRLYVGGDYPGEIVQERTIRRALETMTPRDKQTLMGLVKLEQLDSHPTNVLVGRVRNLVKRDIRREFLNDAIQELSTGEPIFEQDLKVGDWYWVDDDGEKSIYMFSGEADDSRYQFVCVESGSEKRITFSNSERTNCEQYIPVAESIVRAQRLFMNIELNHCRKFKFDSFGEFSFLRRVLERLTVVSQIFCEELDKARRNLLRQMKDANEVRVEVDDLQPGKTYYIHNKQYHVYAPFVCRKRYSPSDPEWEKLKKVDMVKILPQSMTIVGGSATGLMTAIHCAENVLLSGGELKLYNSNNTNMNLFERSQIVQLDARWISMLRYHLGCVFEDTFIPASGESNANLGNQFVSQALVEVTIKQLECILSAEVTILWAKKVVQVVTESKLRVDTDLNALTKYGDNLELGDRILRHVDPNGKPSDALHRWKVTGVRHTKPLNIDDLRIGEEYNVYVKTANTTQPFKLADVDMGLRTFNFEALKKKVKDIQAPATNLPLIYPKGKKQNSEAIKLKCMTKGVSKNFYSERLSDTLKETKFLVDVGHSHVVECMGKPKISSVHFQITSSEPYGFCCISRVNGSVIKCGRLDKFLSIDVENTRFIGDPTKLICVKNITNTMAILINTENWQRHFEKLVEASSCSSLNDKVPIVEKLVDGVEIFCRNAESLRRQHLQTKSFETGDNFYMGMEIPREYDAWKTETVDRLLVSFESKKKRKGDGRKGSTRSRQSKSRNSNVEELKRTLRVGIDRLWFEATLGIIRHSRVYNVLEAKDVPIFNLVNSVVEEDLSCLSLGDSFRVSEKNKKKFEILVANKTDIFARNAEGSVQRFEPDTKVVGEGNLSRTMDGDAESDMAIAMFPVSHSVNHRTIRVNNASPGYVMTCLGDGQSTSHFMRNSGFTGASFNIMNFNNFIKAANDGISFIERFGAYAKGTTWSSGEAIQRGTMGAFGRDGFLRPGFTYYSGLKYIHSRILEVFEMKQNSNCILSHEWKVKFAASMIPRGMELNGKFVKTLKEDTHSINFDIFVEEVSKDKLIEDVDELQEILADHKKKKFNDMRNYETYWREFVDDLKVSLNDSTKQRFDFHMKVAIQIHRSVCEIIDTAKKLHLYDQRLAQESLNQPKTIDYVIGDFALDAKIYPASLFQSMSLTAFSVALSLYAIRQEFLDIAAQIGCIVLSCVNMLVCIRMALNVRRYKYRHKYVRATFMDSHFLDMKKAVYFSMTKKDRDDVTDGKDPFLEDLERRKQKFVDDVSYYNLEDPDELIYDYRRLLKRKDQPAAYKHFQRLLVTYYIPDVYQANSYVQESLVDIYKVCDEIIELLTQEDAKTDENYVAPHLYERMMSLGSRLEKSHRSCLSQNDAYNILRYFLSIVCISSPSKTIPMSTIPNEVKGIMKETEKLSKSRNGAVLNRRILDLNRLYQANREIDKASVVFVSASLSFTAALIFAVSNLVIMVTEKGSKELMDFAFFAQLSSVPGGGLAFIYFLQTTFRLLWLWIALGSGAKNKGGRLDKENLMGLRKVRSLTFMNLFLMTVRVNAILCSLISLPWGVAAYNFPLKVGGWEIVILYTALAGFCLAVITVISYFLVEYTLSYKLPLKLGQPIFAAFYGELESMYRALSIPRNKFDTRRSQERKTWEYVAEQFFQKYRFDFVLGTDRVGSVFQYFQGGMKQIKKRSDGEELC